MDTFLERLVDLEGLAAVPESSPLRSEMYTSASDPVSGVVHRVSISSMKQRTENR